MGIEIVITSHIPEVTKEMKGTVIERMTQAVHEVRNQTVEILSGSRSGRTYKVPGTKAAYYTASAPGEPPAQATGRLRQSVNVEVDEAKIIGYVGTSLGYGPCLEFGTKKMAARPWLRVAFEKAEEKVKAIFSRRWFE